MQSLFTSKDVAVVEKVVSTATRILVIIHGPRSRALWTLVLEKLDRRAHRALPLFIGDAVPITKAVLAAAVKDADLRPSDVDAVLSVHTEAFPVHANVADCSAITEVFPDAVLLHCPPCSALHPAALAKTSQTCPTCRFGPPAPLILLAGCGSRLLPSLPEPRPKHKTLCHVGPRRIIDRIVSQCIEAAEAGTLARTLFVVVGFHEEAVLAGLEETNAGRLNVVPVRNPEWSSTNTSRSAELGLAALAKAGFARALVMNGDVVVSRQLFRTAAAEAAAGDVVLVGRHVLVGRALVDRECVRVGLAPGADGRPRVAALGKPADPSVRPPPMSALIEDAVHESIGIYGVAAELAVAACRSIPPRSYFDDALSLYAQAHTMVAVDISGLWFTEIDTPADLAAARCAIEELVAHERL